jgi:flavin reductase (DIM6/NTAB) family NADH-FMN oxidoreductase RutF
MPQESMSDTRPFRDVMGRFATGVTVVTLNVDGELRGMTANAFCSLSLDPMLVLVCVARDASAHELFERAEAFAVNILEVSQREVADVFARHGGQETPMGGFPYTEGVLGCPILEGTLAHTENRIVERYSGGDHTIVVGEAVGMELHRPDGEPLLFFSSSYRRIDGTI